MRRAELHILGKSEGGPAKPILDNYRPAFDFGSTTVTGSIEAPNGDAAYPGDTCCVVVSLVSPSSCRKARAWLSSRTAGRSGSAP
ncbi:hypothetical protein [Streptomyces sp. NPDC005385]|uniref:EF-Tu C-terminal domain-related protein n=1 Tax=Streptomyces sp. NPDC005385 TaxID=3157039 RepID=UPI0033B09B74